MSSSPRRAEAPPSPLAPGRPQALELPFPYCEVTLPADQQPAGLAAASRTGAASGEQAAEREAQARAAGRQQGEVEARAKFEEQLTRERSALAKALAEFARERAAFYQKVEQEAVQLSLSIARKILHREAQVDPLLLMGIVRVALEGIEGATGVTLAVHPQQAEDWRRYLGSHMEKDAMPEIVADAAMAPEQCELRTSMGTSRRGVEVQMKEIEQGLMDLLAARPKDKA